MERKKLNTKVIGIFLLALLSLPLINCDETPKPPPQIPSNQCTCIQYNLICTQGVSSCWAVQCERVNNKDGKCFLYGPGTIPQVPEPMSEKVVGMLDLYFSAYADAVKAGGGQPNNELIEKAKKQDPENIMSNVLLGLTNDFLYIAMGNDFRALTLEGPWGACEVGTVKDSTQTLALVNAVKKGATEAIKKNSADAVAGPIDKFFQAYPDYRPVYPGACYQENMKETPGACITDALEKRLSLLTGG